ncbi:MAG TPA: DUF1206 domain-containing protein [Chthoniobacterales bacterium]
MICCALTALVMATACSGVQCDRIHEPDLIPRYEQERRFMAHKEMARQKFFGRWRTVPIWARELARVGYAAKALIYLLIGGIALYEAVRRLGAHSSPSQAMRLLRLQPLGTVALGILAVGMCCYGLHRSLEAILGPVRTKSHLLETFHRLGRLGGGCCYLGFAALAVEFLFSRNHSGGSQTPPKVAGLLMQHSLGNSLITTVGAVLAIVGVKYFFDALSGRYRRSYALDRPSRALALAVHLGAIFGICARGVFFLLCGGLTIYSGLASDPKSARGMQGVLALIQKLPLGQWLYGVLGAGFVSYGLFCVVRTIYGTYPSDTGV